MRRTPKNTAMYQKIIQTLGYTDVQQSAPLQRTLQQLKSDDLSDSLSRITRKSQQKRKRINEAIVSSGVKSTPDGEYADSVEVKELLYRLAVFREEREERAKAKDGTITFDQLYKQQKNKYQKFRDRQRVKISDPRYIDMIGAMQMRREKRPGIDRIEKNIEVLESRIQEGNGKTRNKFITKGA